MIPRRRFDSPDLKVFTGPRGRLYTTPTGQSYPSVTTVLGAANKGKDDGLARWRERIGAVEADRITNSAATRGRTVHLALERFLNGEPPDLEAMPINAMAEKMIRKVLTKNLQEVWFSEKKLYSHRLKVAGQGDLGGLWSGWPAIIDFKTSLREKQEEWIRSHFLQCTLYALMFEEMFKVSIPGIVVVIFSESIPEPQVFARAKSPYIDEAEDACRKFHEEGRIS